MNPQPSHPPQQLDVAQQHGKDRNNLDIPHDAEQTVRLPRLVEPARDRRGTVALVLGLLACIVAVSPLFGFVAFPLSLLGVVLGLMALRRARRKIAPNGRVACSGLIASGLGFVLATVATVTFLSDTTGAPGVGTRVPGAAGPNTTPHTVTYKVTTSDGAQITVSYTHDSAEVQSAADVPSPWIQDATVQGSAAVLTATAGVDLKKPDRQDGITCSIIDPATGRTLVTNAVPPSDGAAVTCSANDIGS